jgi:hypothetical protein
VFDFESKFLITAADYMEMFKPLITAVPSAQPNIKVNVTWAKTTLKRPDRISWFLRWYRLVLANASKHLSPGAKQLYEKLSADALQRMGLGSLNADLRDVAEWKRQLEHFMSMPLPEIQDKVFKTESPSVLLGLFSLAERDAADAVKGGLIPRKEDKIVLQFADGFAWWLLPRPFDTAEGEACGHCGNDYAGGGQSHPDQRILSLRKANKRGTGVVWAPHVTCILHSNGYLGEMKGRNNAKPNPEYHSYIVELLKECPLIKGIVGGGYNPKNNFHTSDLSEPLYNDLIAAKPEYAIKGNMAAAHIIEVLELSGDAFNPEDETFTVQSWGSAVQFIRDNCDYDSRDCPGYYMGDQEPEVPYTRELLDLLGTESQPKQKYDYKTKTTHEEQTDYLTNFGLELQYQYPSLVPENYAPGDKDDIETLLDTVTRDGDLFKYTKNGKRVRKFQSSIEHLLELYYILQPDKWKAESELENVLEYAEQQMPWESTLECSGLNDPCKQVINLAVASEWADRVEKGDDIPEWSQGIQCSVGSEWYGMSQDRDYFMEKMNEYFSEPPDKPKPPVDRRQRRLFPEPRTDEMAKRKGITVSSLKSKFLRRPL